MDSSDSGTTSFLSGRIVVDRHLRRVRESGREVKLGGRCFDLLLLLIGSCGRVVDKREVFARVWPGRVVTENNLQVHIGTLRRVFGADAIATVHRYGYRFLLEPDRFSQGGDLIGREALLNEARQRLAGGTRCLTLTGSGGGGKTCVALALAGDAAIGGAPRTVTVLLAEVREPALVAPAIAAAAGLTASGPRPPEEMLVEALRNRPMRLVLDNLEHLVAAAPLLQRLLDECPPLSVICTSRVPLGLAAEQVLLVPPLELPAPGMSDAEARSAAALRLLLTRAGASGQDIASDRAEMAAARAICHRLDGLPLAIELAAAQLRLMSARALLARLDRPLSLLADRTQRPERHRSLRATLAWSHELLAEREQAVLGRLGVFVGGFTLEAADAVCSYAPVDNVHDALTILLDHGLLRRSDGADGEPRYSMPETIREFAAEQLARAGDEAEAKRRHLAQLTGWAERADRGLRSPQRLDWLSRLRQEHGNLRAALTFAVREQREAAAALRLTAAMSWWWYFGGHLLEGRQWQREALALPCAEQHPVARARVLVGVARLCLYLGALEEAVDAAAEAVDAAAAQGDASTLAYALFQQAIPIQKRSSEASLTLMRKSIATFHSIGDRWGAALGSAYLGIPLALAPGKEAEAKEVLGVGRREFLELGDPWGASTAGHYLGIVALREQDFATARAMADEVIEAAEQLGDLFRVAGGEHQLARIELAAGDARLALAHTLKAAELHLQQGRPGNSVQLMRLAALIACKLGDSSAAATLFAASANEAAHTTQLHTADEAAACAQALTTLKQRFVGTDFDNAWQRGLRMPAAQAIAFARALAEVAV